MPIRWIAAVLSLSLASSLSFAQNEFPVVASESVFACMSFKQQREVVEDFLTVVEMESRFPKAVRIDNRLAQTCFDLNAIGDEDAQKKIVKMIANNEAGFNIASPQLEMQKSQIASAYSRSMVIYSLEDRDVNFNLQSQNRQAYSVAYSAQAKNLTPVKEKNIFDNIKRPRKAFSYGVTYYGSTEYVVRRAVGGGTINFSQRLSAVIAKAVALMWGDIYFNDPLPMDEFSPITSLNSIIEVRPIGSLTSSDLDLDDLASESKTKAVFFFRYEF